MSDEQQLSTTETQLASVELALGALNRSANASIRGYLTQTIHSAIAWLNLSADEILVVEGREDIDRFILDEDGHVREVTEMQLKDLSEAVNARSESIRESIFNFLLSFRYHCEAGRTCRMVFATTASQKNQQTAELTQVRQTDGTTRLDLEIDVLTTWIQWGHLGENDRNNIGKKLTAAVKGLFEKYLQPLLPTLGPESLNADRLRARDVRSALEKNDEDELWDVFFSSVIWQIGIESVDNAMAKLRQQISERNDLSQLPTDEFAQILIYHVLTTSSKSEIKGRILTSNCLALLANKSVESLREWANQVGVVHLIEWQKWIESKVIKHEEILKEHDARIRASEEKIKQHGAIFSMSQQSLHELAEWDGHSEIPSQLIEIMKNFGNLSLVKSFDLENIVKLMSEEKRLNFELYGDMPNFRRSSLRSLDLLASICSRFNLDLSAIELKMVISLLVCMPMLDYRMAIAGTKEDSQGYFEWKDDMIAILPRNLQGTELSPEFRFILRQFAFSKIAKQKRRKLSDSDFYKHLPQDTLGKELFNSGEVLAVFRASAGNMDNFDSLPDSGQYNSPGGGCANLRWKLLATLVTLVDSCTLGLHFLPEDILDHVLSERGLQKDIIEAFGQLSVVIEGEPKKPWLIQTTCKDPVIDHALQNAATLMSSFLLMNCRKMSDFLLTDYSVFRFPEVNVAITPAIVDGRPKYTTPHIRLSLSTDHARKIFTGSSLWSDPSVAYRELYQNALDACRYRLARSQFLGIQYEPFILFYHGKDVNGDEYVECEDNGIGMSRDLLSNCFAKAGNRFADTLEHRQEIAQWKSKGINCNINSRFGIGVFSYFLAADRIEVETARLGVSGDLSVVGERLRVSIPTASSFFRVTSLSQQESIAMMRERMIERKDTSNLKIDSGTRVRLYLKLCEGRDFGIHQSQVDIVNVFKKHIWFSEVATRVSDYQGGVVDLAPDQLAPWIKGACRSSSTGNVPFWWLPNSESILTNSPGDFATTHRSQYVSDKLSYQSPGRVLVDGITTDLLTPGFIVNLRGDISPELSLDRRKIHSEVPLVDLAVKAINDLPNSISSIFLSDLWHWDPQLCHAVGAGLGREWTTPEFNGFFAFEKKVIKKIKMNRSYIPPTSTSFNSGFRHAADFFIEIWKKAHDMPKIRTFSKVMMEELGGSSLKGYALNRIPEAIWERIASARFGVIEAAALMYGINKNQKVLIAYCSWLSGETISYCCQILNDFFKLVGIDWKIASCLDYVVSDFDAWLLSRGQLNRTEWCGPVIETIDILSLAVRVGKDIVETVRDYNKLAEILNWEVNYDEVLARVGKSLTAEDFHYAYFFDKWMAAIFFREISDDVIQKVAQFIGKNVPFLCEEYRGSLPLSDEEHLISRTLKYWVVANSLSLNDAVWYARHLSSSLEESLKVVVKVSEGFGLICNWSAEDEQVVLSVEDRVWETLQGYNRTSSIKRLDGLILARALSNNAYKWQKESSADVKFVFDRIYKALLWELHSLSEQAIDVALHLDELSKRILSVLPSEEVSFPEALHVISKIDISLNDLDVSLDTLLPLGVKKPSPTEAYCGFLWQDALML